MKKIYLVFSETKNGKHFAHFETIRTGENLMNYIKRYPAADIVHVCESATQAAYLAVEWNQSYKNNETYTSIQKEISYKGYTLDFYDAAKNKAWDDRYQINKARPYDEADYYRAYSYDKKVWRIVYQNKFITEIKGTFENAVDYIESRNKNIEPRMSYN